MGITIKPVTVGFDAIIPGLKAKRYDASFAGFWITEERTKEVDMVPFFQSGSQYIAKARPSSPKVNGIEDLCGLRVAVPSGSYEVTYAKEQSANAPQRARSRSRSGIQDPGPGHPRRPQ
jgi:polar amino acid transport system substrate-binding protein